MTIVVEGGISIGPGIALGGTPAPTGSQQEYITAGSFSFTVPAGVTSICAVTVGGGGQGGATINNGLSTGGGGGTDGNNGGTGAVRIIWGAGRAFPSTNTGDV
jgi:hypothetical protein